MADNNNLIASVSDGTLNTNRTAATSSLTGNSSLGKDAFLQLLVTQMKYQDPLNPNTDTQFVAQLAQFSQLEQLQNLNSTYTQSQAFSMIGKYVIIETKDSNGNPIEVDGKVDFVTKYNNETFLSVGGNLYSLSDVQSILDGEFVDTLGMPAVEKKAIDFDFENAEDIRFEIDLGTGLNAATKVTGIKVNGKDVPEDLYYVNDEGVVKINYSVLTSLPDGKYAVEVTFNDKKETTVSDKVSVTVKNSTVKWPSVTESKVNLDFSDPKDVEIAMDMGAGSGIATKVAVKINGKDLAETDYTVDADGKLTIAHSALAHLSNGTYPIELTFNNTEGTVIKDKVSVAITNSTAS